MFRNYAITALRNLIRNRLYAAINIVGLAVGFAAALLIALFVRDEFSYDKWIPGYENVYRLAKTVRPPGGATLSTNGSSPAEAAWFKQDIPEVIAATRLWPDERGVRHDAIEANETVIWADADVFKVFPLPAIDGELQSALQEPDTVVITRAMARKYFGRDHVVGEMLEIDHKSPMRVTAVVDDLPARSHLKIEIIASARASISPFTAAYSDEIGLGPVLTYLRLAPGTLSAVTRELPALIDRRVSMKLYAALVGPNQRASDHMTFELQPLSDIHMLSQENKYAGTNPGLLRPSGDKVMVMALLGIGILILLVAVANFVNLMTARASHRAIEVGVRKTTGAQRRDLIAQFIGESILYVGAGLIIAIGLVAAFLPTFNAFVGHDIAFSYTHDPVIAAALFGLLLLIGTLGGLYPAFVLSAFRPAAVLKGGAAGPAGSGLFRQSLVIGQFATLIGLAVATVVISQQTTFAMRAGFRLDTDQLLYIATPCRDAFKNQVAALPGVRGVACADSALFSGSVAVALTTLPDGTRFNLYNVGVESGLLELYGLKPLAGRFLSPSGDRSAGLPANNGPGVRSVVINETAVRSLGYASAEATVGRYLPGGRDSEIIGVVRDFPLRSLRNPIGATLFYQSSSYAYLVVKLRGGSIGETLLAIDQSWEKMRTGRPIARQFYDQYVQTQYTDIVRQTKAFTAFSMVAVFIASLGLFGLSAFAAEQRTKEIGIRKAMGASKADILRLLLWQFAKPVLWANLIAWPVAGYLMDRWLHGFAYHVALDPLIFVGASAVALLIALATVTGHALLVARAKPVTALRYE